MSRRSDTGRFNGNPETQGNGTEEENSIERAFAAANGLDEVMMGGTQTPMPAQKGEFAGSPRQEAERTVLATRKKAQLTERLNKITEEIEATEQEAARELFAESWGTPGEGGRRQRTPERATESPDNGSSSESAMEAAVSQVEMEAAVWLLQWRQQYSGCSGGSSSAVAVGATV